MQIRKTFKAEIAHRVSNAYTKECRGLHGHSYKFEIYLENDKLDQTGMVMDFSLVKKVLDFYIKAFDHSLLIQDSDTDLLEANKTYNLNCRYIIVPYNPTAENMAKHLFKIAKNEGLPICKVIVHETETGCAICDGDNDIDLNKVKYSKGILDEIRYK